MDLMIKANKVMIALIRGKITPTECGRIQSELLLRIELENIKEDKHETSR